MSLAEMFALGEGAFQHADDLDREGRTRAGMMLEKMSMICIGLTFAGILSDIGKSRERRGFRRGSETARHLGPTGFPGHVVTGAYLGAWREAAQFYGTAPEEPMPLPEHIAAAAAQYESDRGPAAAEPPGGWFGVSVAPASDG
jgi:hypothetical protein